MRVTTYNIHRAIGGDGRQDPRRVANVLWEIAADVVALQEVNFRSDIPDNVLEKLAAVTGLDYIAGATLEDERGHYGNAVLTRRQPSSVSHHDISVPGREPRGAIELDFREGGITTRIVATHLGLRPGERRAQLGQLMPLFERDPPDVAILLGDLNEWFLYGQPLRRLRRAFGSAPAPATFPARLPVFALDRLWVRPISLIRSVSAHRSRLATEASDHLPLVADLALDLLDGERNVRE